MSVRIDASTDGMSRNAGLPAEANLTMMCWFRIVTDVNAFGFIFSHTDAGANGSVVNLSSADGTTLQFSGYTGGVPAITSGTNLTVGTWYHIAYVRNGTSSTVYLDGVSNITATFSTTYTESLMSFMMASGFYSNANMAALKIYAASLTQAEILQEMGQFTPVRTANLHQWHPFLTDTADYSGNGRNMTNAGTLTFEDQPPIPWSSVWSMPYTTVDAAPSTTLKTFNDLAVANIKNINELAYANVKDVLGVTTT